MLIAFSLLCFSSPAQSKKMKAANALYDAKEYSKAIEAYKAILSDNLSAPGVKSKIADCYRLTNSYSSAQKYYAEVVNSTERQPIDVYHYAECLKASRNIAEAKKWYGEYVKLAPNDKEALSKLKSCSNYLDSVNTIKCADASVAGASMTFVSPETGKTNVPITFDASKVEFKDEKPTEYYWNFDDNSVRLGKTVKHTFSEFRSHNIKLIVTTEKKNGSVSMHCAYKAINIRPGYKPGNNLLDVQKQDAELRDKTPKKQQ